MTACILQQLALYFAIIYSWQLSSIEKCRYFKDFSQLDFFYTDNFFSFSLTNACLPCRLCKPYDVLWAVNHFVASETPKRNAFNQFWKCKFHFKYFPRNSWFISFVGPANYLYLFKNHWQSIQSLQVLQNKFSKSSNF